MSGPDNGDKQRARTIVYALRSEGYVIVPEGLDDAAPVDLDYCSECGGWDPDGDLIGCVHCDGTGYEAEYEPLHVLTAAEQRARDEAIIEATLFHFDPNPFMARRSDMDAIIADAEQETP